MMSWRRILAMARKEVVQVLRDPRSLLITIAMPIFLMVLFGYAVSLDVKHVPMYVFDRENSPASRDLVARFRATDYFDIVRSVDRYDDLVAGIDRGDCKLAIIVPPDFSQRIASGRAASIQAILDATDNNTASVGLGYVQGVVQGYSQQVQVDWLAERGQTGFQQPLAVQARTWFNEDLESMANIVPGVVALVMAVVGTFLTSLTIAREWERGTMEQLVSTPVKPVEILLGKLAPYFVIGMLDTALCVALGVWVFRVPFRGSVTVLFGTSALFLVTVLTLGYFISVVAKSQLAASQIALMVTFLPAFLLSGFLFPVEQMPVAVQLVADAQPARYFVTIMRNVFLKGTALGMMRNEVLALAVFAVLLTLLATTVFHKKLD